MINKMNLVMKRDLKRVITEHALEVAKEKGFEVLGWLLGFSTEDTVYICDAVPCNKYKNQTRYSAESDPSEEAKLASMFPRNVGIVGLYHSHPFKMAHESGEFRRLYGVSALFHSGTDDAMLRSRSSGMNNYVSIVTDIDNISCYMMQKKRPQKVKENLVNEIRFNDHMRRINSKVQLGFEGSFNSRSGLLKIARSIEEKMIAQIDRDLGKDEVEIQQGPVGNVMRILPFEKNPGKGSFSDKGNLLRIMPKDGSLNVRASMNLTPAIYVQKGRIDSVTAAESMKNEIADYIVYLMWNELEYSDFEKHLSPKIREMEIHLGRISTKFFEKSGMPMKVYTRPKRRMALKKN